MWNLRLIKDRPKSSLTKLRDIEGITCVTPVILVKERVSVDSKMQRDEHMASFKGNLG